MTYPDLKLDERLDWWRIIDDLLHDGVTIHAASEATGIPKSTILGYRNLDAEPKHADGTRLVLLWAMRRNGPPPVKHGSVRTERRAESDEMALQHRCSTCGQLIRGGLLDKWLQLRMHFEQFGSPPTN